jgi:thioredoxin 2
MKPLYDKAFQNFDDMLAKLELPVLVDFYAVWYVQDYPLLFIIITYAFGRCGPCVMMQPVLEEIAGRMEKEIKVAKVDTDKSPRLGSRYKVRLGFCLRFQFLNICEIILKYFKIID